MWVQALHPVPGTEELRVWHGAAHKVLQKVAHQGTVGNMEHAPPPVLMSWYTPEAGQPLCSLTSLLKFEPHLQKG